MTTTTVTLAAWLHNINPVILPISDAFAVRWYGLAYAVGFIIGWAWLRHMSRKQMTPLSPVRLADAMLMLVMGVVVGGRLGYVLFYDRHLLVDFGGGPPWWGVLKLNHGGMASHGGILGVIVACWFISRGVKDDKGVRQGRVPWLHVIDLTAVACTPGLLLGRVANFINGELLGKIVAAPGEPAPWWAVKFAQERATAEPMLPLEHAPKLTADQSAQLATLLDRFRGPRGDDSEAYARVIHALQHGSKDVAQKLEPLISARYPSQLLQAAAEGVVLGLILWLVWWKPRRPGVVGACFLLFYGVMRIATEMIRLPDSQLEDLKRQTGLSMGQWLSVGMVVVGLAGLIVFRLRPKVPEFGGWLRRAAA